MGVDDSTDLSTPGLENYVVCESIEMKTDFEVRLAPFRGAFEGEGVERCGLCGADVDTVAFRVACDNDS